MTTPSGRRVVLEHLTRRGLSQRKACRYLGLSRRVTSYMLIQPDKDRVMDEQLLAASQAVPRFGYRRMAAWLYIGESRVRRRWRQMGLDIPRRRPRRRRSGSDIRLPGAVRPNAVWCYDFVHDQLVDGRSLKLLCVLDEYTRECLAIEVGASLRPQDVILTLSRLMRLYGKPAYVRSDYGAEFTAAKVMRWLRGQAIGPAFICTRQPLAERLRRELQRQAARRAAQPRMVPHARRSQGPDRALATVLQRAGTAQCAPLSPTGRSPPELDRNRYHRTETHRPSGYKKPSQVTTVYFAVWLWNNPAQPFPLFLTSSVGLCGGNRIQGCAQDLLAKTDEEREQIAKLLKAAAGN